MPVAVLSIGTEITRGEIVNTNATWLSTELTAAGFAVAVVESIPDDLGLITHTLKRLTALSASSGVDPRSTAEAIRSVQEASHRDLFLMREAASAQRTPMRGLSSPPEFFQSTRGQGLGQEDIVAVVKALEQMAGQTAG